MTEREVDDPRGIDDGEGARAGPGLPRVFVWGEPPPERGLLRRLVDRLRGENPEDDAEVRDGAHRHDIAPAVFRPPVSRRAPEGVEVPRDSAPVPELPALPGWEPPDLSVDLDVEPRAADPPPTDELPSRVPPPDAGHGPGPLYRATLQLLPGRLRPLDPDIVREEIRFVRPTGRDAVVTLGWAEGEPPDHITVNHPTVQDRHARMSFTDRRWRIESLVASHPVRVNGESLPAGAEPRELQSGDEVRLGDASFHFVMP